MANSGSSDSIDFELHKVTVHGHQVRIASRKSATPSPKLSAPLVVLGGMGANYEMLKPLLERFQLTDLYVLEPPGTGGSSTPSLPIPMETFAKLTRDALDQMGLKYANLMGVSWGGALAQEYAHRFPKRCHKLILVATSPGAISVPASPNVLSKYITPRRFLDPSYMQEVAGEIYGGSQKSDPSIANSYAKSMNPSRGPGYYWQLWACSVWTSYHWLHQIEPPTLVIAGDDDPLVPVKNAKILADNIPNSELEIYADGHLVFLSKADQVADRVMRFLSSA